MYVCMYVYNNKHIVGIKLLTEMSPFYAYLDQTLNSLIGICEL